MQKRRPERRPDRKPLFRRSKTTKRDVVIFLLTAVGITIAVILIANLIEHYS